MEYCSTVKEKTFATCYSMVEPQYYAKVKEDKCTKSHVYEMFRKANLRDRK